MFDNLYVLDCEVAPNYFLLSFKCRKTFQYFEFDTEDSPLSRDHICEIADILRNKKTFGFGTLHYDLPIISYALLEKSTAEIYQLSKSIICGEAPIWELEERFNFRTLAGLDHFDIHPVAKGRRGLKLYGARIHSDKLEELPFDPDTPIPAAYFPNVKSYCRNDLEVTSDLLDELKGSMELRDKLRLEYGQSVMSMSDSKIAEKVIESKVGYLGKQNIPHSFKFTCPEYINFKTKQLSDLLALCKDCVFKLDVNGRVQLPEKLGAVGGKITIGGTQYKLGIGGLHSKDSGMYYTPSENMRLEELDVASYYPNLILNLGISPSSVGKDFPYEYKKMLDDRLSAKQSGDNLTASALKIVLNSTFGQLAYKHSILYSPSNMIDVTLTGQLSMLMLIERLELAGINVISCNTDSILTYFDENKRAAYVDLCDKWQRLTNLTLEGGRLDGYFGKDVNNSFQVCDGHVKSKGIFRSLAIDKNPQAFICAKAVMNYILEETPIPLTIRGCMDVRDFIIVRTVKSGAVYRGKALGKVVRWVYSTEGDTIRQSGSGNKVPNAERVLPIMNIESIPKNLDYQRYILEAQALLKSLHRAAPISPMKTGELFAC